MLLPDTIAEGGNGVSYLFFLGCETDPFHLGAPSFARIGFLNSSLLLLRAPSEIKFRVAVGFLFLLRAPSEIKFRGAAGFLFSR
jgi:hypothetical protein